MDISKLDLNLLHSLDVLLEEASVTGAARRLGISQPAMSAQLARLRRLFGDPLLVPSGRKMVPTVRAEGLRFPLRAQLQDLQVLVRAQTAFAPETTTDTIRLGGTDYAHAVLSEDLICHLRANAPSLRLALMPFVSGRAAQDLESGRMEAAIVTSFVQLDEAKSISLLHEDFVFVQRAGHPRGTKPLDVQEFCDLDHILVSPEGGGFTGQVDAALKTRGLARTVCVSLPSFLLALPLIERSDLVTVLPARLAQRYGHRLEIFPLPFALEGFDLRLVWHVRRHHDPAHIWFRRAVSDFVRVLR